MRILVHIDEKDYTELAGGSYDIKQVVTLKKAAEILNNDLSIVGDWQFSDIVDIAQERNHNLDALSQEDQEIFMDLLQRKPEHFPASTDELLDQIDYVLDYMKEKL